MIYLFPDCVQVPGIFIAMWLSSFVCHGVYYYLIIIIYDIILGFLLALFCVTPVNCNLTLLNFCGSLN